MRALFVLLASATSLFAQAPAISSIVNSGSLDGRFSPGVVATITGSNLGTDMSTGTSVTIAGLPCAVTAVSPNLVNFEVPFIMYLGPSDVVVTVPGMGNSAPYTIALSDSSPAFLTQAGTPAMALFFHADNSLVTALSPARRNEVISGEFVGLGKVNRDAPTGVTPSDPVYNTLYTPTFTLSGTPSTVSKSSLVPGLTGVYRVDIQVPGDASSGLLPGILTINGTSSNTGLIPVSGPPSVQIEAPASGTTASGFITVSGWALDNLVSIGSPISSVLIQVDGTTVGTASYGIARYDICMIYPDRPRCPNVGFSFVLNTQGLAAGTHTVTVVATNSDATPLSGNTSITINVGNTPAIYIDSPATGANVTGIVTVTGWAVDVTSPSGSASFINGVQMAVDGIPQSNANYGVSRPDVCNTFPGRPGCPNVGFMYQLDTRGLAVGNHTVTATPLDASRNPLPGAWTVTVVVGQAPSVSIDSPTAGSNVSGTINVSGWAIDSTAMIGTAISAVQVAVDGTSVGTANYGLSRPDVCIAYPGRAGCPNVGYTYSLNTSGLAAGTHTITVSATDTDGTPDTGSSTVSVNVLPNVTLALESPSGGSVVSGTVQFSGWAIAPNGASITSVNVMVDGTLSGAATYGFSRLDVCANRPGSSGCPNIGFTYSLNSTTLTAGPHLVTIVATDNESTPQTSSTSVMINVSGPLSVFIDSPASGATISGGTTVTGWALAKAEGPAIVLVEMFVDDNYVGLANYGALRPEVCANNPGRPGCPNVGFTYFLDTTPLSAGTHVVKVMAIDAGGPPTIGTWSTSVTVTK